MIKNPSAIQQLTPYFASGAVAVVSVWIGKLWERRSGDRSWLRDERMRASSSLVGTTYRVDRAAAELVRLNDGQSYSRREELIAALGDLQQAEAQLEVVGPTRLSDKAEELVRAWATVVDSVDNPSKIVDVQAKIALAGQRGWAQVGEAGDLLNEFVSLARKIIASDH